MHNRQILFLSRAVVSKDLPRNPVLPDPKWSRKSRSGRPGPVPKGLSAPSGEARAARARPGASRVLLAAPESAPRRHRAPSRPRKRKGPLREGGALGRSGGEARIRTGGKGFAGLCLTTWPLRRRYEKGRFENRPDACDGADNGARTRDPNLGKVVLYQLSHVRLRVINIRDAAAGRKEFFQDS